MMSVVTTYLPMIFGGEESVFFPVLASAAIALASPSGHSIERNASLCSEAASQGLFDTGRSSCIAVEHGIIIGAKDEAGVLATAIDAAAERYTRHFGPPLRPMAVVTGGPLSPAQKRFFEQANFLEMPWITSDQRMQIQTASIRNQIEKQAPDLPPDRVDALVAQALKKESQRSKSDAQELGALSHEIAHLWFVDWYEDHDGNEGADRTYGGTAPDWLDEMAAVLAENEELTQSRRAAKDEPYPLHEYLTMEHPAAQAAIAMTRPSPAKAADGASPAVPGGVRVLSGEEAKRFLAKSGDPGRFYTQSRAFADFMIERTGEPRIFLKIATALRDGKRFEQWLANEGVGVGLPADMAGLTAAWQAWLKGRNETI